MGGTHSRPLGTTAPLFSCRRHRALHASPLVALPLTLYFLSLWHFIFYFSLNKVRLYLLLILRLAAGLDRDLQSLLAISSIFTFSGFSFSFCKNIYPIQVTGEPKNVPKHQTPSMRHLGILASYIRSVPRETAFRSLVVNRGSSARHRHTSFWQVPLMAMVCTRPFCSSCSSRSSSERR